MEQINKIELRGNVGSVKVQSCRGQKVANFTLATNYVYKGSNGEPVIETTWHNVTAWAGKGMPDFDVIAKGSKVYVCGRLRSQRYNDAEGNEKVAYDVLAKRLIVIDDPEPFQYEM